jgi:hypothetical protein
MAGGAVGEMTGRVNTLGALGGGEDGAEMTAVGGAAEVTENPGNSAPLSSRTQSVARSGVATLEKDFIPLAFAPDGEKYQ